jgi:Ser-tRNA(Ala) deacylase AlaX
MSKIIFDDGTRVQKFHVVDDKIVIETSQDITNILEKNKVDLEADKARQGFVNEMHHVARIPNTVIDDLNKMGIMRGFAIVDDVEFAKWLNTTEIGIACKTYRGQL